MQCLPLLTALNLEASCSARTRDGRTLTTVAQLSRLTWESNLTIAYTWGYFGCGVFIVLSASRTNYPLLKVSAATSPWSSVLRDRGAPAAPRPADTHVRSAT